MIKVVKPVVAFVEDIDVWIYYDQQDRVWRYEIFTVGYNDFGEQTTLEFVIEEGLLNQEEFPELCYELPMLGDFSTPWITMEDHFLLLKDQYQPVEQPIQKIISAERHLKRQAKQRILKKLQYLGFDVIMRVN